MVVWPMRCQKKAGHIRGVARAVKRPLVISQGQCVHLEWGAKLADRLRQTFGLCPDGFGCHSLEMASHGLVRHD